jgi:hypothetical protein
MGIPVFRLEHLVPLLICHLTWDQEEDQEGRMLVVVVLLQAVETEEVG